MVYESKGTIYTLQHTLQHKPYSSRVSGEQLFSGWFENQYFHITVWKCAMTRIIHRFFAGTRFRMSLMRQSCVSGLACDSWEVKHTKKQKYKNIFHESRNMRLSCVSGLACVTVCVAVCVAARVCFSWVMRNREVACGMDHTTARSVQLCCVCERLRDWESISACVCSCVCVHVCVCVCVRARARACVGVCVCTRAREEWGWQPMAHDGEAS